MGRALSVLTSSSADFVWTPTFSKLASGRTLLAWRPVYIKGVSKAFGAGVGRALSVLTSSSADFVWTPTFSKLASGRTLLAWRPVYITQYRFRAPMMRLARLLEGLNSLGRGWFYFI